MRYIRYFFLGALALVLISVALANRELVNLQLLPTGLSDLLGIQQQISLPLFIVIFGGVIAGLLVGFVWEWLREHKHRAEAARKGTEVRQLQIGPSPSLSKLAYSKCLNGATWIHRPSWICAQLNVPLSTRKPRMQKG